MNLLPTYINNEIEAGKLTKVTEPPKEYEIDFATGQLTGKVVYGLEAIKAWIWMALRVPRYRHYIYTWDYGNELDDLIGKGYSEEYIEAEMQWMIRDCLLANENIKDVSSFHASFENDTLTVSFVANTIYGDAEMKNQIIAKPEA